MWDYFKMNFFPYDLKKGNTLHFPPAHNSPWNKFTLIPRWSREIEDL